jgi:hypothetical protein
MLSVRRKEGKKEKYRSFYLVEFNERNLDTLISIASTLALSRNFHGGGRWRPIL